MNTTADTDSRYGRWAPVIRWFREHLVAEDPHPEPSVLDLLDRRDEDHLMPATYPAVLLTDVRECTVDVPDLLEPTGLDIDRQHLRLISSTLGKTEDEVRADVRALAGAADGDWSAPMPPIHTHLHELGELTDEQYAALAGMADASDWTPPAPPSHETHALPRRAPIDVTDTLTPGGKALARQRTENLLGSRFDALNLAVMGAPGVSPERRAAAEAYRSALRTRIDAERDARRQGRSARGTGSETQALTAARMYLDRTEADGLPRETWAHIATIVLAEYTGEVAE